MPPAAAALIAIGAQVAAALVTSAIVKALIVIAASVAIMVLSKKPKGSNRLNQGQELRTKIDPSMPRQVLVGLTATGGSCHFVHTRTDQPKKPNRYLYRVIQVSDQPVNALIRVMEGKNELTFAGDITAGWHACNQHKTKDGAPAMWARFYKGSFSAVADATLVSETGGLWTNNHKGTGLAYAIVKFDYDPDAFPNGEPELTFVVEGAKVYDDRFDSTVPGGSGTQRLNTYSTWVYNDTTSVVIAQFLRGFRINSKLVVGVGVDSRDLDPAVLMAAHNTCEQQITLNAGGTEKRYVCGMIISAHERHAEILVDLQAAMDGKIFDRGGYITLLPGANRTPVMNLAEQDVIWTAEKSWQPKASLEQMLNHVRGNFIDRDSNFNEKDLPVLANAQWELDDGGQRFSEFYSFRAINKWTQGQRITKRIHQASRYSGTCAFVGPLWLLELEQGDWFTLTAPRWDMVSKYFEVAEITITTDLRIAIIGREVHPNIDVWGPAEEVARTDTQWTPPNYDLPVPAFTSTAFTQDDPGTGLQSFGVTIAITDAATAIGSIVKFWDVQYALTADLNTVYSGGTFPIDSQKVTSIAPLLPSTSYSFRVRYSDGSRWGSWSSWDAEVTNASTPLDLGDIGNVGDVAFEDYLHFDSPLLRESLGGINATRLNFRTDQGTSAFVNNQADWATYTGISTTNMSGRVSRLATATGNLDNITSVTLRPITGLYRQDNVTAITEGGVITSLGTSAFVNNQGTGATANNLTQLNSAEGAKLGGVETGATNNPASRTVNRNHSFDIADVNGEPIGWTRLTGTVDLWGTGISIRGPTAARLFAGTRLVSEMFSTTPGETLWEDYRVFTQANRTGGGIPTWYVGIWYYTNVNDPIGSPIQEQYPVLNGTALTAGTLSEFLSTITVPANRKLARLIIAFDDGQAANGAIGYVSHFGVTRHQPASTLGAIASTNLFRSNGTTVLTQAEVRTIEGTSAFVNNQADWATYTGISTSNMAGRVSRLATATGFLDNITSVTVRPITSIRRADNVTAIVEGDVITSLGTAAFISNQADWATYTGISTSNMAGRVSRLATATGNLDNITSVTVRPITGMRRADDVTAITEAAVITNLGTAAFLDNQGLLATKNAVDLATTEVLNKNTSNLTDDAVLGITALQVNGVPSYNVPATSTGDTSGSLPIDLGFAAKIGNTTVTTDALTSWSRTVISGTITCTMGASTGLLSITAFSSKQAIIRIDCTHNGVAAPGHTVVINRDDAKETTGGGGSPDASTSSFLNFGTTTWTTIATLSVTAGSTTPALSTTAMEIQPKGPWNAAGGPWNVEMKWVREAGATDVDVGTVANSNPDPEVVNDGEGFFTPLNGAIDCDRNDSGRTVGVSYTYYLMARLTSGARDMVVTGTASVDS